MGKWSVLSVVLVFVASPLVAAEAPCREDVVYLRGDWGNARQGLMFVEEMPTMSGMLFVYDREQTVSFWMKNTLIPLDMIFADGDGVVQRVHENAIPGDLTSIPGGRDIQFVLEINGGMADRLGIDEGTEMRHPAITADTAVWACAS